MTSTPPEAPTSAGPRVSLDEMRDLRRLRRSLDDRKVAGVAGGLGRHLDVDPVLFRVLFVVFALMGVGLLAYVACWVLVPEDGRDRAVLNLEERTRGIVLIAVAALTLVGLLTGGWGGDWSNMWPLALVGLIVFLILKNRETRQHGYSAAGTAPDLTSSTGDPMSASSAPPTNYAPPTSYAPPPQAAQQRLLPPYTPKPPNPKKRGPVLFGMAVAALAFGLGSLGLFDVARAEVLPSAYPALALGIIGALLLLASVWGRGGGLILLGCLSLLALGITSAVHYAPRDSLKATPQTADAVATSYRVESGTVDLDLSLVTDPTELAGRIINLESTVGVIRVIPPAGVDLDIETSIEGVGNIKLLGRQSNGMGISRADFVEQGPGQALHIVANVGVGEILIYPVPQTPPAINTVPSPIR